MIFLLLLAVLPPIVAAQSSGASLTIYRGGIGLVRQPLPLNLPEGTSTIQYGAIPAAVDGESIYLSVEGGDILLQRLHRDVFSPGDFLTDKIGQSITLEDVGGDKIKGNLVTVDGEWIALSVRNEIRLVARKDIKKLTAAGEAGRIRPEVSWNIRASRSGEAAGELHYLTGGFHWEPVYRLVLAGADTAGELRMEAAVTNGTGLSYDNASLSLVEGQLGRGEPTPPKPMFRTGAQEMAMAEERVEPEALGDYHLFSLPGRLSFPEGETITLPLYPVQVIRVQKLYRFENSERAMREEPLEVELSFENSKENRLGLPLPAGRLQVYRAAKSGGMEFAGEDRITAVPEGTRAKMISGRAFDVVGKRVVENYDRKKKSEEGAILIELRNGREDPVTIEVVEHIFGDWVIQDPTHEYKKRDAQTIVFTVSVPAGGLEQVRYTYRKEWE